MISLIFQLHALETRARRIGNGRTRSGRRAAVAVLLLACTVAVRWRVVPAESVRSSIAGSPRRARSGRKGKRCFEPRRRRDGRTRVVGFCDRLEQRFLQGADRHVRAVHGDDRSVEPDGDATRVDVRSSRAARRCGGPRRAKAPVRYPFDVMFPVAFSAPAGQPVRITRGFAVAPGDYDVYVALRERSADPLDADRRLKGAVLKQPLTVPDFWTGELATSTVMLADRIDEVAAPVVGRRGARASVCDRDERDSPGHDASRSGEIAN